VDIQTAAADPRLADELDRLAAALTGHEVVGSFALYYRGRLLEKGEQRAQLDAALAAYDAIWQRFPTGPLFDDALMAAAQLLRREKRSSEAAQRLERLEASFRKAIIIGHYNKLLLDDAAILLGEIYLQDLSQPQRAITVLERFLKRQPTSLLCDDALLLMAEAALRKNPKASPDDVAEACRYLGRLRREYPDGNRVRRAAELAARIGCQSTS
jgi:tetratricopeptide (TPR) repeat protein